MKRRVESEQERETVESEKSGSVCRDELVANKSKPCNTMSLHDEFTNQSSASTINNNEIKPCKSTKLNPQSASKSAHMKAKCAQYSIYFLYSCLPQKYHPLFSGCPFLRCSYSALDDVKQIATT